MKKSAGILINTMSDNKNEEIKALPEVIEPIKSYKDPLPSEILELKSAPIGKPKGIKKSGSKEQVWNGEALKTAGGLTKEDLMQNKKGKIISKKRHAQGLKAFENIKEFAGTKRAAIKEPEIKAAISGEELKSEEQNVKDIALEALPAEPPKLKKQRKVKAPVKIPRKAAASK